MHIRYTGVRWRKTNGKTEPKTTSFSADCGSCLSQCCGLWYISLLMKLMDRQSVEFLAFIQPVVIQQWSFLPILSLWNAKFSLLLVPGKYSYAFSQQPSWKVPPCCRQIAYVSPLRMHGELSERGLLHSCNVWRVDWGGGGGGDQKVYIREVNDKCFCQLIKAYICELSHFHEHTITNVIVTFVHDLITTSNHACI